MRTIYALVTALIAAAIIGCSQGKSLIGTWTADAIPEAPPGTKGTFTYSSGDKVVMKMTADQQFGEIKFKMIMTIDGTYKLEGDKVTYKFDKMDIQTEGLPDAIKAQTTATLEGMKQQLLADMNKDATHSVEWKSNDEIVVKGQKNSLTLKRA